MLEFEKTHINQKNPVNAIGIEKRSQINKRLLEQREIAREAVSIIERRGPQDEEYIRHKEILFKNALEDNIPTVRREATEQLAFLTNTGFDADLSRHIAALTRRIVRQKDRIAKLSLEQALAVRTVYSSTDPYVKRAAAELVTADSLDPRVKKFVLQKLQEKGLFSYNYGIPDFVYHFSDMDSREIPWSCLKTLTSLYAHPSKELRRKALSVAGGYVEKNGSSLAEDTVKYRDQNPDIPDEAFLQSLIAAGESGIPLKKFNALFSLAKNDRSLLEDLTLLLTSLLEEKFFKENDLYGYSWVLRAILHKESNSQSFPFILSSLKKSLFLLHQSRLDNREAMKFLTYLYDPSGQKFSKIKNRYGYPVWPISKTTKPPSIEIINEVLDKQIAELIQRIFPKKDLNAEKIAQINSAWGGIEPFLIYATKLWQSDYLKGVLNLVGDIIAHMDPPDFKKWKKWRYSLTNKKVREQIGFLSREAMEAYSADYFIEACDIPSGDKLPRMMAVTRNIFRDFFENIEDFESDPSFYKPALFFREWQGNNFEDLAKTEIKHFEDIINFLSKYVSLKSDFETASRATETLEELKKSNAVKRRRLNKNGFAIKNPLQIQAEINKIRAELTFEEEAKIKKLSVNGVIKRYTLAKKHLEYLKKKGGEPKSNEPENLASLQNQLTALLGEKFEKKLADYQNLNLLTSCLPKNIDPKFAKFLEKYQLSTTSKPGTIQKVKDSIEGQFTQSTYFIKYSFGKTIRDLVNSSDREIYKAIKNFRIQKDLLILLSAKPGDLTDQQFLEKLGSIKKFFGSFPELVEKLSSVSEKAGEENFRKNNYTFIFTDNPLACLTVGKYPEGAVSCQSYWQGNESLAAYPADAITKLCLLVETNSLPDEVAAKLKQAKTHEEKLNVFNSNTYAFLEAMIARRVTKIVRVENNPYIFLEPVYTSHNKEIMTKHLNRFAEGVLSKRTNLGLVRGGGDLTVNVSASRNKSQYEDGESGGPDHGGIGYQEGRYTMPARFLSFSDF